MNYNLVSNLNLDLMSDERLVRLAQNGDEDSINILCQRYTYLLRKYSRRYYIPGGDHEDLLQESFIAFLNAIRDFQHSEQYKFKPFAQLCVKRYLISTLVKSQRQKRAPLNNAISLMGQLSSESDTTFLDVIPAGSRFDPESNIILKENFCEMKNMLVSKLTKFERNAFHLVLLNGLSHEDAAKVMGISSKGVENAVHRIRKKARNLNCIYNTFHRF